MYSDQIKKKEVIEIDIHPISKWRRILVFLGDFFIHFIISIIIMNIAVMPICSIFVKPETERSYAAEKKRDNILYEKQLLFYKTDENSSGNYKKYDFDSNLAYTFNRFLAYYTFPDETSLNPEYPEYSHKLENEVIWTYYNNIRSDSITYYDLFLNHNKEANLFEVTSTSVSLKEEVIEEVRIYFMPGENLGSKGREYYQKINDLFSALYGCVIQDIYKNDLVDSTGNSFNENQAIITNIANKYYATLSVCCTISYLVGWLLVYVVYPLVNRSSHTPTQSIMKIDRLNYKHLQPINKPEAFLTSLYYLVFDLPFIMFIPLSYTTFIYSLRLPVLPVLSVISIVAMLAGLFIILFHAFNRSAIDLLSQTVMISSEEVDGVIKTKEEMRELELMKKRGDIK